MHACRAFRDCRRRRQDARRHTEAGAAWLRASIGLCERESRFVWVSDFLGPLRRDRRSLSGRAGFGGVKPKQLLELLVLRRSRVVSKDELIESLWLESPPRNGTAAVESYVSVVRARLAEGRALVRTESGGYRIHPGGMREICSVYGDSRRLGATPVRRS
jgi:DNA-binding response OmpR family regulator